jgi:hypothetical protein
MIMPKSAVSVTLDRDNLLWLETRVRARRARSLSQALDDVITAARAEQSPGASRSVAGTIAIATGDPGLDRADKAVRRLFSAALGGNGADVQGRPRRRTPRPRSGRG